MGKVRLLGHPDDLMDRVGTQCKMGPIHTLTHTHTRSMDPIELLVESYTVHGKDQSNAFFPMP